MNKILRYILLIFALGISLEMQSQSSGPATVSFSKDKNYVATLTPRNGVSSVACNNGTISNYESGNVQVSICYMDGLGRPAQQVEYRTSPAGKDLISMQEYASLDVPEKHWLPVAFSAGGAYTAPSSVTAQARTNYGDTAPYRMSSYEEPIHRRVCEEYGAGQLWHDNRKRVQTSYLTNRTGDNRLDCIRYKVGGVGSGTALVQSGSYASGELSVVCTTDEDGNVSYLFTDKLGRMVLQRWVIGSDNHDTYYVYDNRGNLRFVLPPRIRDEGISQDKLDALAYCYRYDSRDRCVWRKLPGCDAVRYVYDKADRLIFVQDGNLKGQGRWRFTIPDALGRTVLSGLCSEPLPVDGSAVEAEFTGSGSYKGYAVKVGGTVRALSGSRLLTVNYYDNYDFLGKNGFPAYAYDSSMESSGYGTKSDARGMLTGSVTVLAGDGAGQLYSVVYYDRRSRPVQRQGSNSLGGKETEYTAYNFTGQPTRLRHVHTAQGKAARTEVRTYSYDHAGRLLTVKHKLDALGEVTLVNNVYDDLGRLQSKSLHGSAVNKQTYTYNIRGWLTGVSGSKFTQNLYYNTGNGVVKYNGSISSMTWKAGNESTVRGYKFTYDGLDRLLNAIYGETAGINTNANRFSENVTGYDKNGNIKGLQRYGQTGASAYGLIDNLTFTLKGNRLNRVDDAVAVSTYNGGFGFKDGVKQANEYTYDANGNLTKDLNKGITNISYNCLNLPSVVTFSDGSTITYTYGADGTKLRTVHKIGSATTTTDYCGNVVYENGVQKMLLTEEGYVNLTGTQQYHYYLKDHQGNNRVVVNQSGTVEETNHYYPFGGVFASTTNVQPYKYNGKEYDTKKGLNWYDYGARHYDAVLGRFTTVDPLAEKYYSIGMYAYCSNNSVRYIDPTGMSISPIYDEEGKLIGTDDEGLQGEAIIMNKSNFKQGMSHEEALSHSLGYNGLADEEARSNYLESYTSLKDRPDYDGYLTLEEANKWYREGKGQPLFTSLAKIDLSGIYSLGEKYVREIKSFNLLLHSGSLNDGLVYGNVTLKRYPNHSVRAFSDKYDFEMHNGRNPLNWGRNIETIIGNRVAGRGQPYEINIYGSAKLTPFLPWIK